MIQFFRDKNSLPLLGLTVLGVFLQVQFNLFQNEYYTGLRIALSDILIPFAGIAILTSLLRQKSYWPNWQLSHSYLWLTALFGVLVLATLHTYWLYGAWSNWALVNKLLGLVVMISYMALGGWISTNVSSERIFQFIQVVCTFFFAILIVQTYCMLLMLAYPPSTWFFIHHDFWYPLEGYMANRNAYALFALVCLSLLAVFHLSGKPLFSERMTNILLFLLPLGLANIGSRASFLALIVFFILLLIFYRKKAAKLLLPFLLGTLCLTAIYAHHPRKLGFVRDRPFAIFHQTEEIKNLSSAEELKGEVRQGDFNRISTLRKGLEIFKGHEIFGAGLGAALYHQKLETGKYIALLDSTPLWLLLETGIAGLLIFSVFFLLCLRQLWINRGSDNKIYSALSLSMFFALLSFGIMCVFHEIAYTRQIWFFLGLALAFPLTQKSPDRSATS